MNTDALRANFEAWAKEYYGFDLSSIWSEKHQSYNELSITEKWWAYKSAWECQQAEIDRLMLEFCPSEMTPEQMETWKRHQKCVDV